MRARPLLTDDEGRPSELLLTDETLAHWPSPRRVRGGPHLADPHRDLHRLDVQGWGVVYPEGRPELLEALEPLLTWRADQVGVERSALPMFPVAPVVDVHTWVQDYLYERDEAERPAYLLVAGDLHEVPMRLQDALGEHQAYVGRVAFDDLDGYRAYATKVVASERDGPLTSGWGLVGRDDGSEAMQAALSSLIAPLAEAGLPQVGRPFRELRLRSDAQAPLGAQAAGPGQVLLTVSHGTGAPKTGWNSAELQRARQGGLMLDERPLRAGEVSRGAVLPRGVWVMFACHAGGSPGRSAFLPWTTQLGISKDELRTSQPVDGRPFVAALPKAVLANPEGPLAVLAHVDTAWSLSFEDVERPELRLWTDWKNLLSHLTRGDRVGLAYRSFLGRSAWAGHQLKAIDVDQDRVGHAILRLTYEDRRAYLLLGDPAARIPTATLG